MPFFCSTENRGKSPASGSCHSIPDNSVLLPWEQYCKPMKKCVINKSQSLHLNATVSGALQRGGGLCLERDPASLQAERYGS